ncbi:MAG: hypothetical protein KIS94_09255 [Chitinophagales bacterium]|nr:hypothetical protein [Chitinophagales bacterium]
MLTAVSVKNIRQAALLKEYSHHLQFLAAYPDNKAIHKLVGAIQEQIADRLRKSETLQYKLFNSGLTGTALCAAFGFELAKWLRQRYKEDVLLDSMDTDDGQISAILSVVMPKVESEILQDCNDDWKNWLKKQTPKGANLLDTLITLFDQTDIRPEVKDELWNALSVNVTVQLNNPAVLSPDLYEPYYHRSLIRKSLLTDHAAEKPKQIKLTVKQAEEIIACSRMVLVRNIREIDPVTFTQPELVSYYQLSRGLTIALFGIAHERRHPIDNYMGYVAFKNGVPVAYAGSWLLFDSARIGLNVFPSYRGGESQYIFGQILELHRQVYKLNRFSVDPYQIGKDNSDGIKSGAFWTYYTMGFEPIKPEQKELAISENEKRKAIKGYRSSAKVLNKLADSRMELILKGKPVCFDATDLSIAYAAIVKNKFAGNRKTAEEHSYHRLTKLLHLENASGNSNLAFVVKNWSVLLMANEKELRSDKVLQKQLRKMFLLKAGGSEEEYLKEMRRGNLRKIILAK